MKKRYIVIIIAIILVISGAVAYFISVTFIGRKPFKNLQASDIVSVMAQLLPPDKTIPIEDKETFTELLRSQVVFKRDDSYPGMAGQIIIFTLTMTDGTKLEVDEFNPFLIINGVGYKCKYGPCEALNNYANMLLEQFE